MTEDIQKTIDREYNIEKNRDSFGREWQIMHLKGSSLYEIHVVDGDQRVSRSNPLQEDLRSKKGASIRLDGRYTKPDYAHKDLVRYLNLSWDLAQKKNKTEEQKEQRASHKAKVEAKAEKDILDAASTSG